MKYATMAPSRRGHMQMKWIICLMLVTVFAIGGLLLWLKPPTLGQVARFVLSIPPILQTAEQQKSLATLETINDHPFYRMTYYGDYSQIYRDLKSRFYWAMDIPKPHCSSFAALNPQGHAILGYNNDGDYWPMLLLFTDPPNGYASISISDLGGWFPGFDKSFTPYSSDRDRSLLLYSPYRTISGMNEMGFAVSTMADPSGSWSIDPAKDTLGASEARRILLDHAKDVEAAIALLSQYNVSYEGTSVSHLLLADRSHHSALVEWVDGDMKVIRNQQPWQVSTNFRVYGAQERINADIAQYQADGTVFGDGLGRNHWRYITAWETLRKTDGLFTPDQSLNLLNTVSIPYETQYSAVYDLTTGAVQMVTERNYEEVYHFTLPMK